MFFFEKKNQKTFVRFGKLGCFQWGHNAGGNLQKFLLLFFKKEDSPFAVS
jgi:hypothetical protein